MSPAVRPARPDEWRRWRELRLRALADAPDAFGETLVEAQGRDEASWIEQVALRPDAIRLIAVDAGAAPVGMAVVVIDSDDQRHANVYAMWVAPEVRGRGVGRQLIDAGLAWARSHAALDVALRVSDQQPAARQLYERAGFAATGQRSPLRPGSAIGSELLAIRLPPLVMGVVNVTPDSFSDGGVYLHPAKAVEHGLSLVADGADIVDVGGEATNPRAAKAPVPAEQELRRILPVIEQLSAAGVPVSVDTTKAKVAAAALAAGAAIINDVSGGLFDAGMPGALDSEAGAAATYIAGHLRGGSLTEVFAAEGGVDWREVAAELRDRLDAFPARRLAWVDPGIGFGKGADPEGNVALVRHAGDIAATVRRPIVVGTSRKRFLRKLLQLPDSNPSLELLDAASTLSSLAAVRAGAHVIRVHNVALLRAHATAYNKK